MRSKPVLVYAYPSSEKVYSAEEMREVFSAYSLTDPVIVVLRQIFQTRFGLAAIDCASTDLSERQAGHAGGRIAELSDFREEILGYLSDARPSKR